MNISLSDNPLALHIRQEQDRYYEFEENENQQRARERNANAIEATAIMEQSKIRYVKHDFRQSSSACNCRGTATRFGQVIGTKALLAASIRSSPRLNLSAFG